jgi:hypothetical protein
MGEGALKIQRLNVPSSGVDWMVEFRRVDNLPKLRKCPSKERGENNKRTYLGT